MQDAFTLSYGTYRHFYIRTYIHTEILVKVVNVYKEIYKTDVSVKITENNM